MPTATRHRRPVWIALGLLASAGTTFAQDAALTPPVPGETPVTLPAKKSADETPPEPVEERPPPRPRGSGGMPGMGGPGGGMGGPGGPGGGGAPGYSATWYPGTSLKEGFGGLPTPSFALVRQSVNAMAPIWADGPNMVMLTAGVKNTHVVTDAVLPDSGRPFPTDLWAINLGLNYMRRFDNGWTAGGLFGFGSSSDKPFHSIREINLSFMGFLGVPAYNERDSWRFSLMYSPVGVLNFPIPGVAYQWNPDERLSVGVGIPLSLTWRPTEDWTLSLMYMPLTNVNARLSWKATDAVTLYSAFEWLNESYFLADRANSTDRFIGLEKRLVGGLTYKLAERLTADLNAGYAFDRQYGEGSNVGSVTRDVINVKSGAFLGGSLRLKF